MKSRGQTGLIFLVFLLIFCTLISSVKASKSSKYDSDFEFEDHDDKSTAKKESKKTWILDPGSDLCHVLRCKKKELCLLEDEFTAVCVSKKDVSRNGDKIIPRSKTTKANDGKDKEYEGDDDLDSDYYDDEEYDDNPHEYFQDEEKTSERLSADRTCNPCPMITKPVVFLCGSDNRTYSSPCRLNYHNCVHRGNVSINCPGFCPCKSLLLSPPMTQEEKLKLKKKQFEENYEAKMKARFNKKYNLKDESVAPSGIDAAPSTKKEVKTFNGIPQPPQQSTLTHAQLKNQQFKDYYTKPKKVSFEKVKSYNDVIKGNSECSSEAFESIGNRLLDWFSVIMADSNGRKNKSKGVRKGQINASELGCKFEVSWMFDHLNSDGDSVLSLHELFNIKNDHNEKCIKPFLDQCDSDGDLAMNRAEWCNCFKKSNPPCTAIKEQVTTGLLGGYVPQCDSEGFYKSIQCHSGIGLCWCVDKHGIEFPSTRTRGKPNCSSFSSPNEKSENGPDAEDDEDYDETEASGDGLSEE